MNALVSAVLCAATRGGSGLSSMQPSAHSGTWTTRNPGWPPGKLTGGRSVVPADAEPEPEDQQAEHDGDGSKPDRDHQAVLSFSRASAGQFSAASAWACLISSARCSGL